MFLIFLAVVLLGLGVFMYVKRRSERQAEEAWTAFADRTPLRVDVAAGIVLEPNGRVTQFPSERRVPSRPATFDDGPSAYVTDRSTGYTQPVTESIIVAQTAYESSSYGSSCSSSYSSDSSSSSSCDSGSSSCSCD